MPATEDAATAVAAFVAYEARALEELAHCASAISPSLHSLLPEIADRLSTQLAAARANGAFLSQMLEDMDLLDAPSEESASDAPPPSGDVYKVCRRNTHLRGPLVRRVDVGEPLLTGARRRSHGLIARTHRGVRREHFLDR